MYEDDSINLDSSSEDDGLIKAINYQKSIKFISSPTEVSEENKIRETEAKEQAPQVITTDFR